MKTNIHFAAAILFLMYANAHGAQLVSGEVLTVDEPVSDATKLEFSDDNKLDPKIGDFEIISSLIMSSSSGERWATVTIKNSTSHQRILDGDHIVAIFANGDRRNPVSLKQSFSELEEITLTLNFGKHKFPILRLLTRD